MNKEVIYNDETFSIDDLKLDTDYNCWRRLFGNNHENNKQIHGFIKLLTNDPCFSKNINDYETTDNSIINSVCICSCSKCEKLHIVRHIPTNIYFAVGSTCIKRFMPELYGNFNKRLNGDICINCKITLWYKTTPKNNRNASKQGGKYCINCIEKEHKEEKNKKLERKRLEDDEKLKYIELKFKNIELKKQTIIRKLGTYDKDTQYFNVCKYCNQEYHFVYSNNFENLCSNCFKNFKDI